MRYERFHDDDGYRWRLKASNGWIIAVSARTYRSAAERDRSLEIARGSGHARVIDA